MTERKPFIVEFTGTPEAGKTTLINILHEQLIKMGYKVKKYPESAEICPNFFPKSCNESKLWVDFDTSKHILEAPFLYDYDIVIFDRGAVDRLFWMDLDAIYSPEVIKILEPFKVILNEYMPDFLVNLYISAEESIRRRGGEGRIVTKDFVDNYNSILENFITSIKIDKVFIDTENKSIEELVKSLQTSILENMKKHS